MISATPATDVRQLDLRIDDGGALWHALAGPDAGIIKEIIQLKIDPSEVQMFVYAARTGAHLKQVGASLNMAHGSGASLDRSRALNAAIGETIERYCPLFLRGGDNIVETSLAQLQGDAIQPDKLALFSGAQYDQPGFPYSRFTPQTRVAWTTMTRLSTRTQCYIPVQYVYLRYQQKEGTAVVCPYVSTGLACSASPAQAILTGLYEAVERDAFTIVWLSNLQMPRLDVTGHQDPRLNRILEAITRAQLTPHLMLLTLDLSIPIVLCGLVDDTGERGACAFGAAANLDPVLATAKALEEAAHTRHWLRRLIHTKAAPGDFDEVRDFDDHVRLFGSPQMLKHVSFLWGSNRTVRLTDIKSRATGAVNEDLRICIQTIEAAGLPVLTANVTTGDVDSCGYYVYRTTVPGLQNINGPHKFRLLGGPRLYQVPQQLGLVSRKLDPIELNAVPHPFP